MKTPTINEIISILNSCLENPALTEADADTNLTDAGMDSLAFVRAVVLLEEAYECEIPDSKLLPTELDTPQKMYELLCALAEEEA